MVVRRWCLLLAWPSDLNHRILYIFHDGSPSRERVVLDILKIEKNNNLKVLQKAPWHPPAETAQLYTQRKFLLFDSLPLGKPLINY